MLETVDSSVTRMTNLLKQLRSKQVVESGQLEEVNLSPYLKDLGQEWMNKHGSIELSIDERDSRVIGDSSKLQSAIFHLLQNAEDAAGSGGQICLKSSVNGSEVLIEVSDDGPGMRNVDEAYTAENTFVKGESLTESYVVRIWEDLEDRLSDISFLRNKFINFSETAKLFFTNGNSKIEEEDNEIIVPTAELDTPAAAPEPDVTRKVAPPAQQSVEGGFVPDAGHGPGIVTKPGPNPVDELAEAPDLSLPTDVSIEVGADGGSAELEISATLRDLDGSETMRLKISGLPEDATLSAGSKDGDTWYLEPEDLQDLMAIIFLPWPMHIWQSKRLLTPNQTTEPTSGKTLRPYGIIQSRVWNSFHKEV